MRRHTKGKDLSYEAIILKILVARLIKVVDVLCLNPILLNCPSYELKPPFNNFWIFLKYSLTVLCSVERHLKLLRTRNKPLRPVLANRCPSTCSQQLISHICYLTKPGGKSSRI